MKYRYDFHLHSCLSPCGDMDMTPCNIVNMAQLLELDIIALTDHNTCGNCRAALEAGKRAGLCVIPGMELCTAEEIHVVCLFPDIDLAEAFSAKIKAQLPPVKNKPRIFGEQIYMDAQDRALCDEEILLVTASAVPIGDVRELVACFGGFCYPAHIDRPAFSILASLGAFPPELGYTCAEVTKDVDLAQLKAEYPALSGVRIMRSSDAHYLENMHEAADTIELPELSAAAAVESLRKLSNH